MCQFRKELALPGEGGNDDFSNFAGGGKDLQTAKKIRERCTATRNREVKSTRDIDTCELTIVTLCSYHIVPGGSPSFWHRLGVFGVSNFFQAHWVSMKAVCMCALYFTNWVYTFSKARL